LHGINRNGVPLRRSSGRVAAVLSENRFLQGVTP
jgi:hypothetical protein